MCYACYNMQHNLKFKYLIVSMLSIKEYNYVFNYSHDKEML